MNPKIKSLPVPKSPAFTVVSGSRTIRFTGERMSWVLPWSDFGLCVLKANPCCRNPKKQPPQELTLYFGRAEVTLLGWHLDSMLPHLADQNISQILTATKRPKNRPPEWPGSPKRLYSPSRKPFRRPPLSAQNNPSHESN